MANNTIDLPPFYADTSQALIPTPKFESKNAGAAGIVVAGPPSSATHHYYEEVEVFPAINRQAGRSDLMGDAVREHETFHGGLNRMDRYLAETGASAAAAAEEFSAAELLVILDDFKELLHSHLRAEPPMIAALAEYSTDEHPLDTVGIFKSAGKAHISLGVFVNTIPVFMRNMETGRV
ncbi:hypothetical protein F4778DRAFT_777157 [Xylariomycetidae sp. FL2044]|nr:hypothetical protein F4778DRAFT_777157 [Xylariomycetidae sp. FL2044]